MSFLLMAKTIKTNVKDPLAKWLLLVLADYSNEDTGQCYPSLNTLAKRTEMNVVTVTRKLNYLETNGFIKRQQRPARSTMYQLILAESNTPVAESNTPYCTQQHKPISKPIKQLIKEDYFPTKELQEKLTIKYGRIDFKNETDKFIDYHQSKGNKFVDVKAAYRNWISNAVKYEAESVGNQKTNRSSKPIRNGERTSFYSQVLSHLSTKN